MSERLTVRRATSEDFPRISEFRKSLFAHNLTRSHEAEYYEWKCSKNPLQQGQMWLAEDGDSLVAIKNVTPKAMKVLGVVIKAGEMGDSFTHPNYQRQGIFTTLSKVAREAALNEGISLIYNTPNKRTSMPAYIRKLNHVPAPVTVRDLVLPLDSKQLLTRKLGIAQFAVPLSAIMGTFFRVVFRFGMRGRDRGGTSVESLSAFPADINALWERVSKYYDVILVRTKEYLEWRYVSNPDTYSVLIARSRNGAIEGYMVTKLGCFGDTLAGFLADFVTVETDPRIFRTLLASAVEDFRRRKVEIVRTWAVRGSFYDKILFQAGFLPYGRVPLLCFNNEVGSEAVGRAHKWHFTLGDTDNI